MPTENIKNAGGTQEVFKLGNRTEVGIRNAIQYGTEELNNIVSIYGCGKGALKTRSVNWEDIVEWVDFSIKNEGDRSYNDSVM